MGGSKSVAQCRSGGFELTLGRFAGVAGTELGAVQDDFGQVAGAFLIFAADEELAGGFEFEQTEGGNHDEPLSVCLGFGGVTHIECMAQSYA